MGLPLSLSLCTLLWEEVPQFLSLKFGRILQWFQVSAVDRCIALLWISLAMVCYEGSSLFCILFLIFSRCVATLPHQTCTWLSLWTVSVASPQILNGQRVDIQPHSPLSFVFHPSCLLVHLTPSSQHPSLTGCRVVLGLTLLCFVVSVWLDLQWPPDLAGGSPPPLLVQIG